MVQDSKRREKENYGKRYAEDEKEEARIKEEQDEEEEEEEEERGPRFGRKYNKMKEKIEKSRGKFKSQEKGGRFRSGKREEERDVDYYMMKAIMSDQKTIDESYNELRRKEKQLKYLMDDMAIEERESISRPSYRTMREIPRQKHGQSEGEPGFFKKLSQIFGCLDRSEKRPDNEKTHKGKRIY